MVSLELERVTVRKGGVTVLGDVDLAVAAGGVLGIVGASGSGKTTVLRAIAGLDKVASGTVRIGDVDVTRQPATDRNVALVAQQPTLFPNRSVARNIAFPLEVRRATADEIQRRVGAEARALHIESLLEASPDELSAGDVQVVQIARSLVRQPSVLLLDEPFVHLDASRAGALRRELQVIQRGFGVTTVLATNDPFEAMTVPDRLAVIEEGRITQVGSPLTIYAAPRTVAAAELTGDADVLTVAVSVDEVGAWLEAPGMRVRAWQPALRRHVGRRLLLVARADWWELDPHGTVLATVERSVRSGAAISLRCRIGDRSVTANLPGPRPDPVRAGDVVALRLTRWVLIDPLDGYALDLDRG